MTSAITAGTLIGDDGLLQSVQVFTASGTWTKPDGIKKVIVEGLGAGGGGARGEGSNNTIGGGGGGGGWRNTTNQDGGDGGNGVVIIYEYS